MTVGRSSIVTLPEVSAVRTIPSIACESSIPIIFWQYSLLIQLPQVFISTSCASVGAACIGGTYVITFCAYTCDISPNTPDTVFILPAISFLAVLTNSFALSLPSCNLNDGSFAIILSLGIVAMSTPMQKPKRQSQYTPLKT